MLLVNHIFHIIDSKHVSFNAIQVLYADAEYKLNITAHKVVCFV